MAVRAILLANSRAGTHIVKTALAQHPDVLSHEQRLRWPDFHPTDTGKELFDRLFVTHKRAVVLPLDFGAGSNTHPGFWDELSSQKVRVIHLRRWNMVKWFVSLKLAESTNRWIAGAQPERPTETVTIDYRELLRTSFAIWRKQRQADRYLREHQAMYLWYEQLSDPKVYQTAMAAVQRFLEVAVMDLRPTCFKQESRPLREIVTNYTELARCLVGSPFEMYLDEAKPEGIDPRP